MLIKGNVDIIVITETKIDETFPSLQFSMEGYALPFRLDRCADGGGILIYIREDIPCKELKSHAIELNFKGIFLEINLRKCKWLLLDGYNYNKANIDTFLGHLEPILDYHMTKLENFLLLGDFNSEMKEACMNEFCETYNLKNLIDSPMCFKNVGKSLGKSCTRFHDHVIFFDSFDFLLLLIFWYFFWFFDFFFDFLILFLIFWFNLPTWQRVTVKMLRGKLYSSARWRC